MDYRSIGAPGCKGEGEELGMVEAKMLSAAKVKAMLKLANVSPT